MQEFKHISKSNPKASGYSVDFIDDNVYHWEVRFFDFGTHRGSRTQPFAASSSHRSLTDVHTDPKDAGSARLAADLQKTKEVRRSPQTR